MAALFRRSRNICQCQRQFSTVTPRQVNLQWENNDPEALADVLPSYPYGPTRWYKQSRLGLYGGSRIQFGNNVSDKFETKTRRKWRPNILTRHIFSKALNRHVQVRVSARVLRTIDKLGGLDEYLLGEKEARIRELGETGWWLRWAIMQTPAVKARFAEERKQLGLPEQKAEVIAEREVVAIASENIEPEEDTDLAAATLATESQKRAKDTRVKFRVAPKKHLYYTGTGWRRSWAQPWLTDSMRASLTRQFYPNWLSTRVEAAKVALRKQAKNLKEADRPTALERQEIIARVEVELKQELNALVDKQNERRVTQSSRKSMRKSKHRARVRKLAAASANDEPSD